MQFFEKPAPNDGHFSEVQYALPPPPPTPHNLPITLLNYTPQKKSLYAANVKLYAYQKVHGSFGHCSPDTAF